MTANAQPTNPTFHSEDLVLSVDQTNTCNKTHSQTQDLVWTDPKNCINIQTEWCSTAVYILSVPLRYIIIVRGTKLGYDMAPITGDIHVFTVYEMRDQPLMSPQTKVTCT